jgi:hypothetical protein
MDGFLDLFWNLDQIRGWAETRNPEVVRAAALPKYGMPKKTLEIAVRSMHTATDIRRSGRDVDAELWAASGWPPPETRFTAPPLLAAYAEKHGIPSYQAAFNKNVHVIRPWEPAVGALIEAWASAPTYLQEILSTLFRDRSGDEGAILTDPLIAKLSPDLTARVQEYVSRRAPHGPPHVFIREPFPTIKYLEHLFRLGKLEASGNLPGDPRAQAISADDWGGLEIAVGGDQERLGVWMRGQIKRRGRGDFEYVRVARGEILQAFPAQSPEAVCLQRSAVTDDEICEIIKAASERNGGFIAQNAGAELVQQLFPQIPRDRARRLVKQVTRSDKPGPKGPRLRKGA